MKKKEYAEHLKKLQAELVMLQHWVKETGARIVIVFEGRDTSGKGGVIKAITEKVSPRIFRVVALPKPTDREKTQLYIQRYIKHMPAAGEVILFDRSWYNRALVEPVMGFCTQEQTESFLESTPRFEKGLINSGIYLFKYWLEVSSDVQKERLNARIDRPVKQWKLSDMDIAARARWYDYSCARDRMFAATDTEHAPWHIVPSDNKEKARLNLIRHMLEVLPYEQLEYPDFELPKRDMSDAYDDKATLEGRRFVPELYS